MKAKNLFLAVALGMFAVAPAAALAQSVGQDMKNAGHDTADASKKVAHKTEEGTKTAAKDTGHGTKVAATKTAQWHQDGGPRHGTRHERRRAQDGTRNQNSRARHRTRNGRRRPQDRRGGQDRRQGHCSRYKKSGPHNRREAGKRHESAALGDPQGCWADERSAGSATGRIALSAKISSEQIATSAIQKRSAPSRCNTCNTTGASATMSATPRAI